MPRYSMSLALRVIAVEGSLVDVPGQTQNIGYGGVRFFAPAEMPVGTAIDYVLTLSEYSPASRILCAGRVLRCRTKAGRGYEVAVTMDRYGFVHQGCDDRATVGVSKGFAVDHAPWRGERSMTADLKPIELL